MARPSGVSPDEGLLSLGIRLPSRLALSIVPIFLVQFCHCIGWLFFFSRYASKRSNFCKLAIRSSSISSSSGKTVSIILRDASGTLAVESI